MKNNQVNQTKSSFEKFQKFALKIDQKKKVKGGTDIVTEDLADI